MLEDAIVVIAGSICGGAFLVYHKIKMGSLKKDKTRRNERTTDTFKVLEVYQQSDCYVVKCEGRIYKEIPQSLTTIEYVQKKEDMRLEVVVLTSYYTRKRWLHKDEKYHTSSIIESKLYILEGSMGIVLRFF